MIMLLFLSREGLKRSLKGAEAEERKKKRKQGQPKANLAKVVGSDCAVHMLKKNSCNQSQPC